MFASLLPTTTSANQLLPQLLELGRRPIKRLVLDIETDSDILRAELCPPVTEILKNLPYGIRFNSTNNMNPSSALQTSTLISQAAEPTLPRSWFARPQRSR